MKVHLLHRDGGVDPDAAPPPNAEALLQDLELRLLVDSMGDGDQLVTETCRTELLSPSLDPDTIAYRQDVLRDCLAHPDLIRQLYDLTVQTLQAERRIWGGNSPASYLYSSIERLELFVPILRQLEHLSRQHLADMRSEGLRSFLGALADELDEDYFAQIHRQLHDLRFRDGVLLSAGLGRGNTGHDYVLRRAPHLRQSWFRRLFVREDPPNSFRIAERDDEGANALAELRARGTLLITGALRQSADQILQFLRILQGELAFYVGCLNLSDRLARTGAATCFPVAVESERWQLSARGLYDVGLRLSTGGEVVGNDCDVDGQSLVIVTGANQGGKSTFLRSVGSAQLMLQCGMFVCARSLTASLCPGVFTHYKREEDASMTSGKLDEELRRMSDIADRVRPGGMVLFNESFAATNEREGSQIAREVIRALGEAGVKVVFVTHLFDLAHGLFGQDRGGALFLRSERQADGGRTFRLVEGEPLPTSYGEDVFRRVFGPVPGTPDRFGTTQNEDASPLRAATPPSART